MLTNNVLEVPFPAVCEAFWKIKNYCDATRKDLPPYCPLVDSLQNLTSLHGPNNNRSSSHFVITYMDNVGPWNIGNRPPMADISP